MTIRFIQSSDNKYVQYRLMSDTWSTTVADWQGVDDGPIAGSDNLVKSGGVADKISELEADVGKVLYNGVHAFTTDAENIGIPANIGESVAVKITSDNFISGAIAIRYFDGTSYPFIARINEQKVYSFVVPEDAVGDIIINKGETSSGFDAKISVTSGILSSIDSIEDKIYINEKENKFVKDAIDFEMLFNDEVSFKADVNFIKTISGVSSGDLIYIKLTGNGTSELAVRYYNGSSYSYLARINDEKSHSYIIPDDIADSNLLIGGVLSEDKKITISVYKNNVAHFTDITDIKDTLGLDIVLKQIAVLDDSASNTFIKPINKGDTVYINIKNIGNHSFNVKYHNGSSYPTLGIIPKDGLYCFVIPSNIVNNDLILNSPAGGGDSDISIIAFKADLISNVEEGMNKENGIIKNAIYPKYNVINYGVANNAWYGNGNGEQRSWVIPCPCNTPFKIKANAMDYAPFAFVKEYPVESIALADINCNYPSWNAPMGQSIEGTTPSDTKYMIVSTFMNGNTTPTELYIDGNDYLQGLTKKVDYIANKNAFIEDALHNPSFYDGMNVIRVKKDGTGDFTNIQDAINSVRDASYTNQYDIQVYDDWDVDDMTMLVGVLYPTVKPTSNDDVSRMSGLIVTKDFVHVRGYGAMKTIYVHPRNKELTARSFAFVHNVFAVGNCVIANFHLKIKGGRYAIHQDTSADGNTSSNAHKVTIYKDIIAEHLGNSEYTNGSAWTSTQAVGNAISSGQLMVFSNVKMISHENSCGFSMHTNANYDAPTETYLYNCEEIVSSRFKIEDITSHSTDLNSGWAHKIFMYGCKFKSFHTTSSTESEYISILGCGNTPMLTWSSNWNDIKQLHNIDEAEEIGFANSDIHVGDAVVRDSTSANGWKIANANEIADGVACCIKDGYIKVILSNKATFRLEDIGLQQQLEGTYIKSNGNGSWATTANKSEATFVCITNKVCKFVE